MKKSNQKKEIFTEHDFIAILLPLLSQNGIHKINERGLEEKIFPYYENPNFQELFQDIVPVTGINRTRVNLQESLYQEKYFGCNILFDQMHSEDLILIGYDTDFDFSYYEESLSEDAKLKLRQIAKELAVRYRAEHHSHHKLNIYGVNPNDSYRLIQGKRMGELLGFQLVTDGDIKSMKEENTAGKEHYYYESPINPNQAIQIREKKVSSVEIENASFAIKQGFFDDKIRYSIVNTEIVDPEKLNKIVSIANQKNENRTDIITNQAPYVKKIVLN